MHNLKNNPFILKLRESRIARMTFLASADAIAICVTYYLAFWLRLDILPALSGWPKFNNIFWISLPCLIAIRLICNWFGGQYRWSFSHADLPEAGRLFFSTILGSLVFLAINHFFQPFGGFIPRSIYALEGAFTFICMALVRFSPKYFFGIYCQRLAFKQAENSCPTLVYGAGGNAEILVKELLRTTGHPYKLVGLIDDAPSKFNVSIAGLRVLGSSEHLSSILQEYGVKEILITIPHFSGAPLRRLMDICAPFNIRYKIVPPYRNVLSRRANVLSSLEDIKPEALINRPPVPFDSARLAQFYCGQTAFVTGAAGSIGSEICFQLAACGVKKLILFDIHENGLFFLLHDIKRSYPSLDLAWEVGSVQDGKLVSALMNRHRPDIVLHAAAHKHVPLMEHCPAEAVKNNVLGTYLVCKAARESGASHFLLISTDKAAKPANIMGATKRLAELAVGALSGKMRCTIVRFGNVLGSNGSLLQIIQRQIHHGGPVTITDPKMTRFFMTIPEAIGLVLVTPILAAKSVFVLEMGEEVSIDRLVRNIVSLSGLVPEQDIEIVYTHKRPGEKLREVLVNERERLEPTEHRGIWAVCEPLPKLNLAAVLETINDIEEHFIDFEELQTSFRNFIQNHVPEFEPWVDEPSPEPEKKAPPSSACH